MFDSCICADVDDGPAVCLVRIRKAVKEHECCECLEKINPGERYEHVRGLWDGCWSTYKTCMTCYRIRGSLFSCGWYYGEMWTDIHQAYCADRYDDDDTCVCPPRRR